MIELRQDSPGGQYHIRGYKPNEVLINETTYTDSLIISPQTLIEHWRPKSINDLLPTDWNEIIALEPKVVLLGTGTKLHFPTTELMAPLIQHNIGYEIMDTAAACRTFTVLMAEDRLVVAGLLLG